MNCYLITMYGELIAVRYAECLDDAIDWAAMAYNDGQDTGLNAYMAPVDTRAPEQKAFAELTHSVCTKAKSDPRYINQCANLMNVRRSNELNVNVR